MIRCGVCGYENSDTPLFCGRCTSPLNVIPLHQLGETEHRQCLAALFEILAEVSRNTVTRGEPDRDLWQSYLSAFWLRPETALILYAEAMAIKSLQLNSTGPWLDLGCGDGIHAAIYSRWRFDTSFDAFSSLDLSADDMYNRFDPSDFSATILRKGRAIDFGVDIKSTAVARAAALNVFTNVRQADATALPLGDRSLGVIFSNMLRDLGDPLLPALRECRRVLRDDGRLLLSAMTPEYANNLYFVPAARREEQGGNLNAAAQLLKLDRGRSVFCQQQLSVDQWSELLKTAGLRLISTRAIVGPSIIRFWDVGLRPFIHALLAQRQAWKSTGILAQVKQSLLPGLDYLLSPLLRSLTEGEPCMQLLELRKD